MNLLQTKKSLLAKCHDGCLIVMVEYAIDPNMQNVINFTFDSYIAGQSTGFIAKELNNRGLMYGNTSWRGSYVAKLIRDERLIGKHIRYSKQIKGVKRVVIETIPNFYPVVVDVEKFFLANNMLTSVAKNIRKVVHALHMVMIPF